MARRVLKHWVGKYLEYRMVEGPFGNEIQNRLIGDRRWETSQALESALDQRGDLVEVHQKKEGK